MMIVVPESFNSSEMESVGKGCIPMLNRFHLIFETKEEAESVKEILERLIIGGSNENY